MMHGLGTGFLVAAEVTEHVEHTEARATLARLLGAGNLIAIAPQVLAEFIHVVTDPRRFTHPLDLAAARQLAEQWWTVGDVVPVFPDDSATEQYLGWIKQFSLATSAWWTLCSPQPTDRRVSTRCSRRTPPTLGCSACSRV